MIFGVSRKCGDYRNILKSIIDTEMLILGITDLRVCYSAEVESRK